MDLDIFRADKLVGPLSLVASGGVVEHILLLDHFYTSERFMVCDV